jgi:arylsulfatase
MAPAVKVGFGTFNETYVLNGLQTPFDSSLEQIDEWGTASTYPHYHAGWAMAGNTPFRYFKQSEHRGGQTDHLVVHWPDGIKAKGEIRDQYHHIADIAPTIMEAAGIEVPDEYHGVAQQPMDGVSMMYSFDQADAPNRKKRQYYEMFGNRAIWSEGWKAVTLHAKRMPWDVNVVLPFDEEAWKYNVYPLYDDMIKRIGVQQDRLFGNQKEFIYFAPRAIRIAEKSSAPVKNRTHTIETTIDLSGTHEGVIVAVGGMTGGFSMFVKDHRLYYDYNFLDGVHYILKSSPLPKGPT